MLTNTDEIFVCSSTGVTGAISTNQAQVPLGAIQAASRNVGRAADVADSAGHATAAPAAAALLRPRQR